jgi:VRR-NUC domain
MQRVSPTREAWLSGDLRRMVAALERPGHPIERHFAMMAVVQQAYAARKTDPEMRDLAISMGRRHVAEFGVMKEPLREDIGFLPRVPTFASLATCLAEAGEWEEAVAVCRKAIDFGLNDGTKGGYEGRIARIERAARPAPDGPRRPRTPRARAAAGNLPDGVNVVELHLERVNNAPRGKAQYDIAGRSVFAEEAAAEHYRSLGFRALWSENDYWWMLMSLLFWDVIFARVAGAVATSRDAAEDMSPADPRFEAMFGWTISTNGIPADFFSTSFFQRRQPLIEERMRILLTADLAHEIQASYRTHFGTRCRPIEGWQKFSLEDLTLAADRLERETLLRILHRLLEDFSANRSGLPDLVVVRPEGLGFAEVKSENDKISPSQRHWHEFLARTLGLRVDLCLINPREKPRPSA